MCRMCDGFSAEDVIALDAAHIAEYGYAIQGVVPRNGAEDGPGSWVYTVGLLDAVGHPEMIIAGAPPETSSSILSVLAESALAGERYEVGETIDLDGPIARVAAVHEIQYELGTFNTWHGLKGIGVFRTPDLVAVQITLPCELFASGDCSAQPLLAHRAARVDQLN